MSTPASGPVLYTRLHKSAQIVGPYRYRLDRAWSDAAKVAWVMLNPSLADHSIDDPTIRRCMAFTHAWGYGGLVVVNLYAYRSPYPTALRREEDPIGPQNDAAIQDAVSEADIVVAAWGRFVENLGEAGLRRTDHVRRMAGPKAHVLGLTKDGRFPLHPLYLPASLKPQRWASCLPQTGHNVPEKLTDEGPEAPGQSGSR